MGTATAVTSPDPGTTDLLHQLYRDFNARRIDDVLATMIDGVRWSNGWEGGFVIGQETVRAYWERQWEELDPTVTPTAFALRPDGRIDVTVHQVVRDMKGEVVADGTVHHVYRLGDGHIVTMDIE